MTTIQEPTGEAWVRQVNKRLALLERIPRSGGTATIAAADLDTNTSIPFEADAINSSGSNSDPSLSAKTITDLTGNDVPGIVTRTVVDTERNLSIDPFSNPPSGWYPNDVLWTRETSVPITGHPAGITTAVRSGPSSSVGSTALASFYNIDGLANTTVARGVGAWAYVPYPCDVSINGGPVTKVPANTWTFCSSGIVFTSWSGMNVIRNDGGVCVVGETGLFTGSIAQEGTIPESYFDGNTPDTDTEVYSWEGVPGASVSVKQVVLNTVTPIATPTRTEVARNIALNPAARSALTGGTTLSDATVTTSSFGGQKWFVAPGATYLYGGGAPASGGTGYYAAAFTLSGTPGTAYSTSNTDNTVGSFATTPSGVIPASGTVRVDQVSTAPVAPTAGFLAAGLAGAASGTLRISNIIIQPVSGPGMYAGPYFDGSSNDTASNDYVWTGTVDGSASVQYALGVTYDAAVTPDSFMVEDYDETVPTTARTDLQYAPVTPSAPFIESRATGVAVIWDGNGAGGESIPVNLLLVEVHRSTEGPLFDPTEATYAGSFLDAGLIAFDDQEYEVQWWYRFVLVTNDGLRSTPSDATDGTAHKIAPTEVGFSASDIDFDNAIADAATAAANAEATAAAVEADVAALNIEVDGIPAQIAAAQAAAITAANNYTNTSASGKNKVTYSTSAPTASDANIVGDVWWQQEANQIKGQWVGQGGTGPSSYVWQVAPLRNEVIATLDAAKINTGTLDANRIGASTITTTKLLVGDVSNMAEVSHTIPNLVSYGGWVAGVGGAGGLWAYRNGTKDQYWMFRNPKGPLPFKTGDRIRMTFEAYASTAMTFQPELWTYGPTLLAQDLGALQSITTTPATYTMEATVTVDCTAQTYYIIGGYSSALVTGEMYVRNVRAYVMNAGELIVDGTILAAKIATGTITAASGVIGSIDASVITVGQMDAARILAGSITSVQLQAGSITADKIAVNAVTADKIATGLMSAQMTISGSIIAGNPSGARIVLDSAGFRQYTSATDMLINFPVNPAEPSQFEGAVLAESLAVAGNFTLQGATNWVQRAAELRVASGTTAPTSPVSVAVGYETYDPARWSYLYVPTGMHGMVDNSPDLYGVLSFFGGGKFIGPSNKEYVFPQVTDSTGMSRNVYGAFVSSAMVHTAAGAARLVTMGVRTLTNGAVASGSIDTWDVTAMNSSGTTAPTLYAHLNALADGFNYTTKIGRVLPAIGSTLYKERFSMANWDLLNSQILLKQWVVTDASITQSGSTIAVSIPFVTDERLIGVTHGSSDRLGFPGAAQFVWLVHGSVNTYAYNATGTARIPQYDFPTPPGAAMMNAYGDVATNQFLGFRTTTWSDVSVITKMTNNHWDTTTTSSTWWVGSTWYDPDATGGTHETELGTFAGQPASIVMKKRAGLTFTVPTYPERPFPTTTDDPTAAKVYLGRNSSGSYPGRTAMQYVTTVTMPNRSGYIGDFTFPTIPPNTASTPPPAASNFPTGAAASPGKITSADGVGWVLSGDGKVTMSGVVFDPLKPGLSSAAMRQLEFASDLTTFTTVSTTGATMGTQGAQGTFVAPPSGTVQITVNSQLRAQTAGQAAAVGFEVRTGSSIGSGTVVMAADINRGSLNANTSNIRSAAAYPVTGLVPGDTYNVRTIAFSASGASTATIGHVRVFVEPSA